MEEIKNLEPKCLWKNFYLLTQVPRPSGHLEKIQAFLLNWARERGIEAFKDGGGNIVMRKSASTGMGNRKKVVLQAHMDMVPQKETHSNHNFETDPIDAYIDGEWVKAKGTTLGSDDGMGVASIMSVFEDDNLTHGPLEALITADEETCMYGVNHLAPDTLTGSILLNLDDETLGEFIVGSAGGTNISSDVAYKSAPLVEGHSAVRITITGLRGGHSGLEINDNRANANKLMARLLQKAVCKFDLRLSSWQGGNMRNSIPRTCEVIATVPTASSDALHQMIADAEQMFRQEYTGTKENIELHVETAEMPAALVPKEISDSLISAIIACHDGVLRDIPSIPHITETSSNLAIVNITPGKSEITVLARSSSESMMDYVCSMIERCFSLAGMKTTFSGRYGAWQPNFNSQIATLAAQVYKEMFKGEEASVQVVHAGLECSLIGQVYPQMDLVSFGPTLRSPHTPDERCHIPSVAKYWDFLKELLSRIPER